MKRDRTLLQKILTSHLILLLISVTQLSLAQSQWNQFRGPNGSGVASDSKPPVKFDLKTNLRWSVTLPTGHSSPVLWNDKIFVTGMDKKVFETICIDRNKGTVLWRTVAPAVKLEHYHRTNSPASSTAFVDEHQVYVYFSSYGLLCYDHQGKEVWKHSVTTPKNLHGNATSPIVYKDLLYLIHDSEDADSYLLALNAKTGKSVWSTKRTVFNPNWSTPTIWPTDNGDQLVVLGGGVLKGYEPLTGKELWTVDGFGAPIPIPVVGDSYLYASTISGEQAGVTKSPLRWAYYREFDKNSDGKIHVDEIPQDAKIAFDPDLPERTMAMKGIVTWMDRDEDMAMTEKEFQRFLEEKNMNVRASIQAIKPDSQKPSDSRVKVVWKFERSIPHMTSCIYFEGKVYMVKAGGIVTCLDAETGQQIYRKRLGKGTYSSSPIISNGNVYVCSQEGVVTVFKVGNEPTLIAHNRLGETINATPAISKNMLLIRTNTHLHAFAD